MRNFGQLGGSLRRAIRTQAGSAYYPSPLYHQENVGYPYFYGSPSQAAVPDYPMIYVERQTSKRDVQVQGIQTGGAVASSFITGLFDFKKAKLGYQPGAGAPVSYDSGGGSSKLPWILGGVLVLGLIAGGVALAAR